jgi:Bacterial Ig-like domain (group 3)
MNRRRIAAALAVCGGLLLAPYTGPAGASGPDSGARALAAPRPPVGKAWLVGVVTDQAGHPLNDVNVEAWSADGTAKRVASSLTYESIRNDGQNGFFLLEVPIHAEYLVVVSGNTDDAFRTFRYRDGEPVTAGLRRERSLGTLEIARTALQPSATTARLKPTTVKAGKAGAITVAVTCTNVDPVLGKVTAVVAGKKVTGTLDEGDDGRITLTLPKLKKPGRYTVEASYLGDSYVKKSTTKLTLTVKK